LIIILIYISQSYCLYTHNVLNSYLKNIKNLYIHKDKWHLTYHLIIRLLPLVLIIESKKLYIKRYQTSNKILYRNRPIPYNQLYRNIILITREILICTWTVF